MYRFDGSTVLVIKTDVTHTVTHQTTHILPPAGTQNALGESHKKASTQQAARRTGVLARCRRAHCARFERWRSQKHRWWPSAGVSGGGRDLTIRADDPTSRGTTQPGPTTQPNTKQPNSKHDSEVGPSACDAAGVRDGSVGSVPKADRLGCELRQPPFLYPLDHVQAVGGRAGWPRAGGGEGVRR